MFFFEEICSIPLSFSSTCDRSGKFFLEYGKGVYYLLVKSGRHGKFNPADYRDGKTGFRQEVVLVSHFVKALENFGAFFFLCTLTNIDRRVYSFTMDNFLDKCFLPESRFCFLFLPKELTRVLQQNFNSFPSSGLKVKLLHSSNCS